MSDRAQVETTVSHKLVIPAAEVRAVLIAAGYQVPDDAPVWSGHVTGDQFDAHRIGQLEQIVFQWREKP